jgi:hypothetical protein
MNREMATKQTHCYTCGNPLKSCERCHGPFYTEPKYLKRGLIRLTPVAFRGRFRPEIEAVFPGGEHLGLKPDEFEIVDWHTP